MSGPTLVTGAGGFIGSHVVAALTARGEAVRALDFAFPAALPEGVARFEGSILDEALLRKAAVGVRAVIHCAAMNDLWIPRRILYDRVNMRGTCEVLITTRQARARMVHVSSHLTLIGGSQQQAAMLDESVELTPAETLGPCPRTRREAELAVLSAARTGHDALVVIPSVPVGPGDLRPTAAGRMIRDLASGQAPGMPEGLVNLVDVRALAEGVIAARDHGRAGVRYLLTGTDIELAEIARQLAQLAGVDPPPLRSRRWAVHVARVETALARLTGRPPRLPLTAARLAGRRGRFSNARAREELGFSPPPVEATLADTVRWLRAAGLLAR